MALSDIGIGKKYSSAIEIDKDYIKIVEAEFTSKGTTITKLLTEPISGFSDDDIFKALPEIIKSNNIRFENPIAIISRDRTMVRYIRLPATLPEEVDDMVSFEITKQIPYSQDEVISDYKIIDVAEDGYSEIMLVVIHKAEADRVDNILRHLEKKPAKIRFSSDALFAWLMYTHQEKIREGNICLVNIDADHTEIVIISDGKLAFSRVASIGSADISKNNPGAEASNGRLLTQINSSVALYKKAKIRGEKTIAEFLVTGAGAVIDDFSNLLHVEMNRPASSLSALEALSLGDDALTDKGISQESSVCDICGSLFIKDGINLISSEQRKKQRLQAKIKRFTFVAVVAAAIISLFAMAVLIKLYKKQTHLKHMKSLLQTIEPEAKKIEDRIIKLEAIKAQSAEGTSSLDAIYHIHWLIPPNISLIDFNYDEASGVVRFRGTAEKMSDVSKLPTILEKSEKFSNVQIRSAAMRRKQQGEVVDFQIWCNFTSKPIKKVSDSEEG
ncbi:MAG: pilus assembly protein PilM [Candidatus Omnitrophota bacterium]